MALLVGLPLKIFHFFFVLLRLAWPLVLLLLVLYILRRRKRRTYDGNCRVDEEPHFKGPVYTVDYEEVDSEDAE